MFSLVSSVALGLQCFKHIKRRNDENGFQRLDEDTKRYQRLRRNAENRHTACRYEVDENGD